MDICAELSVLEIRNACFGNLGFILFIFLCFKIYMVIKEMMLFMVVGGGTF